MFKPTIRDREAEKCDNEDNQVKRQKVNDIIQMDLIETTKITNVNTDCLEIVFKHLGLSDLLNVADSCKHFKEAADIVFTAKYGKKAVVISEIHASRIRLLDVKDSYLKIDDLKTILQLLRCFGHLISKLKINLEFASDSERITKFGAESIGLLVVYIGLFCLNSLTNLKIKKGPVQVLNLLKRPFLRMERVELQTRNSKFRLNKSWFSKLFPNVRHLKYESIFGRITDFECIDGRFPSLERLDISYPFIHCKNIFNLCSITDEECIAQNPNLNGTLHLNPQLRSLSLPFVSDFRILRKISEHQQQLECLSFQYAPKDLLKNDEIPVHFRSLRKLKICFCSPNRRQDSELIGIGTQGNEMQKIPLSFNQLEELTIQTCYQYSDEFFNFISKHQTIVKLNLRSCGWPRFYYSGDIDRPRLLAALPMLKEIHVMCYRLRNEEALAFTTEFKALEKFCFKLHFWDSYSEFVSRLSSDWCSSLCSHRFLVTLKRTDGKRLGHN